MKAIKTRPPSLGSPQPFHILATIDNFSSAHNNLLNNTRNTMAPTQTSKTVSSPRKPRTADDDDKWLEVEPERDTKSQQNHPPPPPQQSFPPPVQFLPPPPPLHPQYDQFGRLLNPTSRIQQLENEIIDIASIDLGLLNAIHVLETHLIKSPEPPAARQFVVYGEKWTGVPLTGSNFHHERNYATQTIREMSNLIGLSKSIQLLRNAVADKDLVEIGYELKVVKPVPITPPPAPPPVPLSPPMPVGPSYVVQDKEFRTIAKEVVKDAIHEYSEESQKEMIKLVRDVCLKSLE